MNRVRLVTIAALLSLSLCLCGSQAQAWEFTMEGAFTWELEEMGQTGRNGFFGPYDVDAGAGGGSLPGAYAPYNFWIGSPDVGTPGVVSGSDAGWNTQYMGVDMQVRMNKAVRIRGNYYIGAWNPDGTGNLVASEYLNSSRPGIQRSFSPGYWNTLWLTAQLPWGEVAFGKRASTWGTGLSFNGDESRSSESLGIKAPFGPFNITYSFYPSRRANVGPLYYNPDIDKNNTRLWDMGIPALQYRCGPIDMGVLWNPISMHSGGEAFVPAPGGDPAARLTTTYRDTDDVYADAYFKYYNGRFFFNAEITWDGVTNRNRKKLAGGGPAPGVRDTYIEHWRYMLEASALAGPARIALLYAWFEGDDRRGGQFNAAGVQAPGNVTYIDKRGTLRSGGFANSGLFRPYSMILAYQYGTGAFINTDTTNGYVEDAVFYGARADYSVAANLNLYGTFVYAERQSKSGFGWGCISPNTAASDGSIVTRGGAGSQAVGDRVGAPNIPDTGLGWEVDAGVTWKFLEGLVVNSTVGYWQPGAWYKFACIDKSVAGWGLAGVPGSTIPGDWGINPNRSIDPVWQWQIVVNGEF